MKKITVKISDEQARRLAATACERGLTHEGTLAALAEFHASRERV